MVNINNYLKGIAAAIAPIGIGLETAFPGNKYSGVVIAIISAVLVVLVPNLKPTLAETTSNTASDSAPKA